MKVLALHGAFVGHSGRNSVGRLGPGFVRAGFDFKVFKYGWRGVFGAWLLNDNTARDLVKASDEDTVLIGHSNGCPIILEALKRGCKARHVVFFNPALDNDVPIPEHVFRLHVFYTHFDIPTRISRFIPGHAWGMMGATGYDGPDIKDVLRVRSYNGGVSPVYLVKSHGGFFNRKKVAFWARMAVNRVLKSIQEEQEQ